MVEGMGDELTLDRDDGPGSRRPRAVWGALAAIAVLAGTLAVVAAAGGGDGSPRALPVGLGGAGFAGVEGAATADSSMAAWITYVAGDGLPSLGGEAPAYELVTDLDQDRVRSLAKALGLEGEVGLIGDVPDELSEPWRIESDDGAVLEVYGDGFGGWWYQAGGDGTMGFSTGSSGSGSAGWAPHPGGEECVPGPAVDCAPVDDECIPGAATDCSFGSASGDAVAPTTSAPECATGDDCSDVEATYAKPPYLGGDSCTPADGGVEQPDSPCQGGVKPGCTEGASELCQGTSECTVTEAPDGSTMEECVSHGSPSPADLPSREEAQAIALDLLSATGLDVDDARVTVEGPFDAWYVMVEPALDGVPVSGWISTVGVGSEGAITSASGTLATAERVDDYPLLDTRAAIERLSAQSAGFGGVEPMPAPEVEVEVEVDSGSTSAQCPDAAVDCETADTACIVQPDGREICEHPTTTAPCAPQPDGREICEVPGTAPLDRGECVGAAIEPGVDPATTVPPAGCDVAPPPILPEPEPIEVVLTGADRVLILAPAVDGSGGAYLVPGYRFTNDEGHTVEVIAVADDALAPTQAPAMPEPSLPPPETTELAPRPGETTCETSASGEDCDEIASSDPEVVHLSDGEKPQIGVPYYVDVDVECHGGSFSLGGQIWQIDDGDTSHWSRPHEGGTFTLDAPDHGVFRGDSAGAKTATFLPRSPEAEYACSPTPRA